MRADARKNYDLLLGIARAVVTEQGAEASLRDIARRAEVGLGTLYRHFPTRDALFEALLRDSFDALAARAAPRVTAREKAGDAAGALVAWLRQTVAMAHELRGVIAVMVAAIDAPDSALHGACVAMKAAGTRLLVRAQAEGSARRDVDGADLFALVGALAWLGDQPALAPRADHLFRLIAGALLVAPQRIEQTA
jgi:AcrR family transcriptional regulator